MSDLETEIDQLKKRAADAERARILAEVKAEEAKRLLAEHSRVLEEKYGILTVEDAHKLILALRQQLEEKKKAIEELMDKFEGV